ncbi:unnamed protein product [Brachionus calyciflorus]|uniref:Protein quiver n=1 Tax=Brachionus calyciflorus TaxID=104777 RepID=A0A813QWV5_9BILA|nr:unnamed protein product [Brachionus calyciflorus]
MKFIICIFLIKILLINCENLLPSDDDSKTTGSSSGSKKPSNNLLPPPSSNNYYSYLRCWKCDYDDTEQCVKNFDFTKHKHEPCDGKCLKAFEKTHARTKEEIAKAQMTPTIRKCVSQKEIQSLNSLGINTGNGCHDIRTTKRKHKLYCFCENDLCNGANKLTNVKVTFSFLMLSLEESQSTRRLKKLYSHTSDHLNEILNLVVFDTNKQSPGDNSTDIGESRINVISVNTNQHEFLDEMNDVPDEWMTYDFERKRSCILSNIYSTCVTNAINHLEALQISIDKWLALFDYNRDLTPSPQSSESSKIIINFVKRKSIIKTSNGPSNMNQKLRFYDQHNSDIFNRSNQLQIQGHAFDLDKTEMVIVENEPPVDDLKAGSILEEILILIARLELDRKRTEKLLTRERDNLNTLKSCIENMALKRAVEIPLRVQHEHDACITDITELNWHISFNTKAERKLLRKVEIEERLHQHLKEQITNIKKNTPLIEEKINAELAVIQKIDAAQADVDDFVNKAKLKLQQTQEKSSNAYNKAAKEREAIQADLASCKRDLNKAKKRLQEALESMSEYAKTIVECAKKVEENLAQEKIETTKRLDLRNKNESLNDENKKIQMDIFRIEKDNERVAKENGEKEKVIEEMNKRFNEELSKLMDTLNKKLEKLEKILKKKQEKEVDLEEMARDRTNMENKILKEERNRERLLEDRQRSEEELKLATLDLGSALKLNSSTIAEYEKEMRRLENREDNLKKQISELRKQIGEERNQLSNLINRLNAETDEYLRAQQQYVQKKAHFEQKKIELDGRLSNLQIRVEDIESKREILLEEVRILNEKLAQTLSNHNHLETTLNQKILELEPKHSKASQDYFTNKANLDYMKTHSNEMNKKIDEMNDSQKYMIKNIEKTNREIENLESDLKEATIQRNSSKKLENLNQNSLEEVQNRIDLYATNHSKHIDERNEYMKKMHDQMKIYLDLNKELASRYRYIKYVSYNKRLDLMRQIEIKLNSYVGIKDKRQVISLQERMHFALADFYKFKIKNGEKNYYDLAEERELIGDEINSLEDLLYQSVHQMTKFLESQADFSQIRQKALEKVLKQELIEKQAEQDALNRKEKQNKKIKESRNAHDMSSTEQESGDRNGQFKFPLEGVTLRERNRNLAVVPPVN